MTRQNWYWDLNMPFKKIKQILARENDPRFPRIAGTLLARVPDPKQVFELITATAFCRRYQVIENEIKSDEWTKERAAFWKTTYLRLSKELQEKGERIRKPEVIKLDAFNRALVEKIKQCRKAAAMSQKELAQFMGYSQQFISGIERGRERISAEFLKRMSETGQRIDLNSIVNNTDGITEMLLLKPNQTIHFCPISKWDEIAMDQYEDTAHQIFLKENNQPDSSAIKNERSIPHLISYLRYDFKKVLLRTRLFYIDNYGFELKAGNYILKSEPLIGYGFFEPLINCFICAENIGHFKNYNADSMISLLKDLGGGYKDYAKILDDFFRNGLAHRFRPYGSFDIDLNTESEYESPCLANGMLKINIPHFIDSLVLELERLIGKLKGKNQNTSMDAYLKDLEKIENKSKYFEKAIDELNG